MTAPSKTPPIYVTKPSLPPLEELIPYLEQIWTSGIITNGGPFHQQLEQAIEAIYRKGAEHFVSAPLKFKESLILLSYA